MPRGTNPTGVVRSQFRVGILPVPQLRRARGTPRLVETIGKVPRYCQRLNRREFQSRRIREVHIFVAVPVRILVKHDMPSVTHLVVQVRRAIQPRPVRVLHREVRQRVTCTVRDQVIHATIAQRRVG